MKKTNAKCGLILLLMFAVLSCTTDDQSIEDIDTDFLLEEEINTDDEDNDNTNSSDLITETITDWNDLWLEIDRYTNGMRPNATARALAYIHLAAYETAVHSMNNYTSNASKLNGLNINNNQRDDNIDVNIALNTCYAEVIDHFMFSVSNNVKRGIQNLENRKENELSDGLSNQTVQNSRSWGNYVAQRIIDYSETDRNAETQILNPQPFSYEPPVGDGFWTYSADAERAWFPYWSNVRTFVISTEETSSVPPPISYSENTNSDYYAEMLEVYNINNTARAEGNEDLWIAEFWSDDVEGLMMSPPGRQISIANQLIEQTDLDYTSSLELLLRLGFSLNDAAVSSWADKYEYMVMRPSVYIQEFIDADFRTNLYRFISWPNPSFPGYPSGHSTFASAAAGVFINEFGNSVSFTDRSHEGRTEFRSTPRQFDSFEDMAEENAFSRVPFGVHIRMDCTEGLRLGYEISDAVVSYNLFSAL